MVKYGIGGKSAKILAQLPGRNISPKQYFSYAINRLAIIAKSAIPPKNDKNDPTKNFSGESVLFVSNACNFDFIFCYP